VTAVKVCGITTVEAAAAARDTGADLIGFVFAPSRRRLAPAAARDIMRALGRPRPLLVGVFVDAGSDGIEEVAQFCSLDLVQLHGDAPPALCSALSRPVIRALPVRAGTLEREAALYRGVAAYLLFDSPHPAQAGGTGRVADWSLAAEAASSHDTILAGGLDAHNVVTAIAAVRPWGVDASSGLETNGAKDPLKIAAFVSAAKGVTCK